eukprot:COSAG05_NODE_305_length_11703_cov_15.056705_6_plen_180_part_00
MKPTEGTLISNSKRYSPLGFGLIPIMSTDSYQAAAGHWLYYCSSTTPPLIPNALSNSRRDQSWRTRSRLFMMASSTIFRSTWENWRQWHGNGVSSASPTKLTIVLPLLPCYRTAGQRDAEDLGRSIEYHQLLVADGPSQEIHRVHLTTLHDTFCPYKRVGAKSVMKRGRWCQVAAQGSQ